MSDLDRLILFLIGESDYDGRWFGEKYKGYAMYWWRKPLRAKTTKITAKLENIARLGNEFDRMHKMIPSRYVAERIFAVIAKEDGE